ncbi:MAG: beta-ketoacyl-[acyl-carrier-protein] synthase I [Micavibrio sp.]|nr:beta-ketoacyl-[acyl-carrier-protein] synthase I [Micavibrio sp.]
MTQNVNLRRVVVTGMGIVSCIGNTLDDVIHSLKNGVSGIVKAQEHIERGFRSHVHGMPKIDIEAFIDRKLRRFMGDAAAYNYIAMKNAIDDSGLTEDQVSNERAGLIVGSGGGSTSTIVESVDTLRETGATKRIGPYAVTKTMGSTTSACLATPFKIKGVNYSISSACATSAHCIGNAVEMIQWGKQDVMFAGGAEELHWSMSSMFDAMGALSSKYNDTPEKASRAYDADRDGFVIAGGGGVLVLEELEHAKARGAKIYAEVTGYGATSDGYDMVAPSGEGGERAMEMALKTVKGPVDYINSHGTSTPAGDITELNAIDRLFSKLNQSLPKISSTKSLTGHSLGATGVQEAIYSILMMKERFITASANIVNLDEGAAKFPIVQKLIENVDIKNVLSNSFGFGGTNASLAFSKYEG